MSADPYVQSARRNRRNVFYDERFEGETVRVDGNIYDGCDFYNCHLEYAAYAVPSFRRCHFKDSEWVFVEAAANMIAFLSQLPHDFGEDGKQLFDKLVEQLKEKRIEPPAANKAPRDQHVVTASTSALLVSLDQPKPDNLDRLTGTGR